MRALAYRMLGTLSEADDAVQETWLRLYRTDTSTIENLGGWLTTVAARVCLNMLRSRDSRREDPLDVATLDQASGVDPEQEAELADSVGLAPDADLNLRRRVVDAFLAAIRGGNFEALVALLHPDVVLRADRAVIPTPEPVVVRGAHTVAQGAMAATGRAQFTGLALVNGTVGLAMAPHGRLVLVLSFTIADGKITEIDVIADPDRLGQIEIAVLDDSEVPMWTPELDVWVMPPPTVALRRAASEVGQSRRRFSSVRNSPS